MKWRRFGFLRHYRKIKVEGTGLRGIVNKCIRKNITLRNIRWKSPLESTMDLQGDDMEEFRRLAGHSHRITVLEEGGVLPFFRNIKSFAAAVTGAFLIGALIFYQGLFVAEIRVEGYASLREEEIRAVLREEGLYEGARKPEDYGRVKRRLYEEFRAVTWVSVHQEGRLVKVSIAEGGETEEKKTDKSLPVDIIASRSGMVEKIIPLKGNAAVEKGDYVNKGDVLISGTYSYQSTNYQRGDDIYNMYSHAEGQVMAKVPRRLTFYLEKNKRREEATGRGIWGLSIKIGDLSFDTTRGMGDYESSRRKEKELVSLVKPLPFEIKAVKKEEVRLEESRQDYGRLSKVVEAAVREYGKESLSKEERIVSSSIDFYEENNVIRAEVFLEVLEDIGEERIIRTDDSTEKEKQAP